VTGRRGEEEKRRRGEWEKRRRGEEGKATGIYWKSFSSSYFG